MEWHGWQGRILRVDLSSGVCAKEPLNREWAQQYLGQRGLGTKYLVEEGAPGVDPLDPGNPLIFVTGPLTGTMASTGGRYSVVTKGALTNAIAASNSGGNWGAELKFAGWDLILFTGRAREPVYLFIEDGHAELLAADFLWGRSVWEVEPEIKARHMDPAIKVASIGRAGEIGVRYACVVNDLDRAAGRSGVGAVMGAKNLKAIAVRGTGGVAVNDPGAFMEVVSSGRELLADNPAKSRLEKYGTHPMLDVTNKFGSLPTRNAREVQFEGTARINALATRTPRQSDGRTGLITNKACFACTIGCGRVSNIDPSHFSVADKPAYHGPIGGLEYESAFALAPMCGVDDIEAATYANAVCNEQGMDPISFGVTVAAAMELFEVGVIGADETGGMEFRFGNAEALVRAVDLTAVGEGFGRDLGLGSKRLCEKYGRPELAMVVKGQEFPGYDPRAMQGMALAYATSNRGACHLRATPFADDFGGGPVAGKAAIVKDTQDKCAAIDSTGMCAFSSNAFELEHYSALVEAACGGKWSEGRLLEIGERIWNLERQFNLAAGMTRADDTLPPRSLEEALTSGSAEGRVAELDQMLPGYYELRGWDGEGVPTRQTLVRLGLSGT